MKNGFTLIELMVVVGLIGVISVWLLSFDYEWGADKERRDRFVQKVTGVLRYAKTTAVSGRTTVVGNCSDYVLVISQDSLVGKAVTLTNAGTVNTVCWTIPEIDIASPIFGDGTNYKFSEISGFDKSGALRFRISDPTYSTGPIPVALWGQAVALIISGTNIRARTMPTCADPLTCIDYASYGDVITLKLNVSYRQPPANHLELSSRDIFLDLRSGNIDVKLPTP